MIFTQEKVREVLTELAEPSYAEFSGGLLEKKQKGDAEKKSPSGAEKANMLGVRLPKLRGVAKQIVKADGIAWLEAAEFEKTEKPYMEEILLYGMVIGSAKEKVEVLFPYIRKYVGWIDNWSLCDSFCCGLKQTRKQMPEMWEFLQPYLKSDKEFELRFAVVMLMNFYIGPEYIDRLLMIFDGIHHEGYYVKMAVAWALSMCLVKEWEKSYAYMCSGENHLDKFTYLKTIQKCRESYQLTKEQKELLAELKKKRDLQ